MAGRQTNAEKFTKYSNMSLRDIEQRIEELREVVYEKKGKRTEAKYHNCATPPPMGNPGSATVLTYSSVMPFNLS